MAKRLDIIVFGATGFTGKRTLPEVHRLCSTKDRLLSWGVAGRSEEKLKNVLNDLQKQTNADLSAVPIITADVNDANSLRKMSERANLVINCCGPYRFYGEPVVKACVETGTHHLDVTGEPQYMEQMQIDYHEKAQEKGVYIISSCGVDSVPVDLGVIYLENNFHGTLNSVEAYMIMAESDYSRPGPVFNYATWETLIHGFAHNNELRSLRSKLFKERLPVFKPILESRNKPHQNILGNWSVPFSGCDRSVVKRSQYYFYQQYKKRPVQAEVYLNFQNKSSIYKLMLYGAVGMFLGKYSFGRSMLLKNPSVFSGGVFTLEGPSEEKQNATKYCVMLHGQGWSEDPSVIDQDCSLPMNKTIMAKVTGTNPGYGMTCTIVTLAAIVVLTETSKLPTKGGVYTPAAAFAKTTMLQQLQDNGIKFEILHENLKAHL